MDELLLQNWFGTTDRQRVDDELSPFSDQHVAALKRRGTRLLFAVGTHDMNFPYAISLQFVDKLRRAGVPVRFETHHRLGHSGAAPDYPQQVLPQILRSVPGGNPAIEDEDLHYRPKSADQHWVYAPFVPDHEPVAFEAPKAMVRGGDVSFFLTGEPSTQYEVVTFKLDDTAWLQSQQVVRLYEEPALGRSGTLPGPDEDLPIAQWEVTAADELAPGLYLYNVRYRLSGQASWTVIPHEGVSQPGQPPHALLYVLESEPKEALDGQAAEDSLVHGTMRSWGLGGDILFSLPAPDVKANGQDGPVTIGRQETLQLLIALAAQSAAGLAADWWVVQDRPAGGRRFFDGQAWVESQSGEPYRRDPLSDLGAVIVTDLTGLTPGEYVFSLAVDMLPNGVLDEPLFVDQVTVMVRP